MDRYIMDNRVLLTALGLNPKETTYTLGNRICKSLLSPVALYNLLPEDERFDRVLALCTEEVLEKTFPLLREELPVVCEPTRVHSGVSAGDLQATLHNMLEKIPEKAELILDVTHGFRHYPFLFFTACLYLKALKDVKIKKIWYGRLDAKNPDGAAPFMDLSILLEMVDWFHVVQSFRDMSNPKALAKKLSDYGQGMKRPDERIPDMAKKKYNAVASAARDFAELFGMGLPLELGMSSAALQGRIAEFRREGDISATGIPLADDLLLEIGKAAERFRVADGVEKRDLVLDLEEIHRQEKLIDAYFEAGYHNNAIGLIRELVISRLMLSDGKKNWLDRSQRKRIERCIGALVDYSKKKGSALTDDRKKLAGIWSSIIDARNKLHHHGMTKAEVSGKQIGIPEWWKDLKQRLDDNSFWDCGFGGGSGRLLISALGLHPGFLYNALREENPEECLVIASHETVSRWDELARRAGYSGDFKIEEMNAHSFDGIKKIVDESEDRLVRFDEVVCNLTGGTAAMQYAVIQLARRAEHLGRNVRWIAVIDNRSVDEQKLNPYVEGVVVFLEDAGI
ncbi:MAG: TIGR02221 family CRISPR-associated protein [Methanothrix sp.]|uniref:TIGR02221 family CRISPR-associated protein n=1 Tax=Methanothrix sp. TaxID=90426 RepID=UPI00247B8B33|nr:TIGR02221 family CRISPR-associated protein [Methanothrix sp.]